MPSYSLPMRTIKYCTIYDVLRAWQVVYPQEKSMMSFRTYLQSRLAPSSQWYAIECLVTGKWTLKFY